MMIGLIRICLALLYTCLSAGVAVLTAVAWFVDGGTIAERLVLSVAIPLSVWLITLSIWHEPVYRQLRVWVLTVLALTLLLMIGLGIAFSTGIIRGQISLVAALAVLPAIGAIYLELVRPRLHLDERFRDTLHRLTGRSAGYESS